MIKLILSFFLIALFHNVYAACKFNDYKSKSDDLKLEMYNTTLLISDLSEDGGKIVCFKMKNKEWSVKFPDSSGGAVNAGFFTDKIDYFYVTWVSPDGHLSYTVFEAATGRILVNIESGRNMPSVIWSRSNKSALPLICVNNDGIFNYSPDERRETDGVYKYNINDKKYIKISHSTRICS
jgi:hypothetical protein